MISPPQNKKAPTLLEAFSYLNLKIKILYRQL